MTEQDITERLREKAEPHTPGLPTHDLLTEAADTIESLRAELAARDAEIARAVECLLYSAGTTTDPHTARQIVTVYTRLGGKDAK